MVNDRILHQARLTGLCPSLACAAALAAALPGPQALAQTADSVQGAVATDSADAAYVDRLIDGGTLTVDSQSDDDSNIDRSGNMRSLVVELGGSRILPRARIDGVNTGGFDQTQEELGLTVSGRYQTVNYGLLGVDAQLRTGTSARAFAATTGQSIDGALTLSSMGLPLGHGWVIDTSLGNVTTQTIDLVRRQQRFFIPTSPLVGASAQLHSYDPLAKHSGGLDPEPVANLNLAIGEPGLLGGIRLGNFSGLSGLSVTAGGQADIAPGVSLGVQAIGIDDSRDPFAVIAPAAATQRRDRLSSQAALASIKVGTEGLQLQANAIWSNVTGNTDPGLSIREAGKSGGVWIDASLRRGRTAHSGGLYYLGPRLAWGTGAIVNNAYGGYYRVSSSSQRWRWTASIDAVESVNGQSSSGILANLDVRRQLTFSTAVGANGSVRDANGQTASQVLGFIDVISSLGTTRVEAGWSHDPASDFYRIGWNQNWTLPAWFPSGSRLGTQLSFDHRRIVQASGSASDPPSVERANSFGIGVSAGANPFSGITVDTTLAYRSNASRSAQALFGPVDATGGVLDVLASQQDQAFSATLVATARLSSRWTLTASFTDTRSSLLSRNGLIGQSTSPLGFTPEEIARIQRSAFRLQAGSVTLQYVFSGGRRTGVLGRPEFPVGGTGGLRGRVFLDANDNGLCDAGERGVPDILVILDGLQAVRTDAAGVYRFESVVDGRHEITVNADALPLPWSIVSDPSNGRNGSYVAAVNMRVRSVIDLDIPAIRQ